ncbi:hypothetical protein [Salinispora fenicalii]|uniref:hypothetical protein n=1 Tax=Salinispora fenicalii TaxID=1137263 RepID=UPI0004B3B4F4|nr:hypothetical protein [Salinispora fenicalii]
MDDLLSAFRKLTAAEVQVMADLFFQLAQSALDRGRTDSAMAYAKVCLTATRVIHSHSGASIRQ